MILVVSLFAAILFWVFIFIFFIKRADKFADEFVDKFEGEIKDSLEKLSKEIRSAISQTIERSSAAIESAEKELIPKLDSAKRRIELSEKKLTELLSEIKIKKVVKEVVAEELKAKETISPTYLIQISEYYGDFPKTPPPKKIPYEPLRH